METRVGLSSAFPGRDWHVSGQDHLWFLSSGQEATAAEGGSQEAKVKCAALNRMTHLECRIPIG